METAFKKVCRLAGEAIVKHEMITPGSRILVGLSGGKDSFVLLRVLCYLRSKAPVDFELTGATFDPGYPGIDTTAIGAWCRECGCSYEVVKLDMASIIAEKSWENAPCVLCSRLRRGKLYGLAKALNCDALALGQHLDDAIASFFMSLCRGQGITSMGANIVSDSAEKVRVIRPLIYAAEELIERAAQELGYAPGGKCPYEQELKNSGDREYFRRLTDRLAEKIPGVRANILHSFATVEKDHLPF